MKDQQAMVFKEEAGELLAELEASLLDLEKSPDDEELIGRIFRAMHTIKGSGAMFGFDEVAAFTHNVETIYDLVRNDKLAATKHLVDLTLAACDQIRRMIDGVEDIDRNAVEKLNESFKKLLPTNEENIKKEAKPTQMVKISDEVLQEVLTYRICFKPDIGIWANGTNTTLLLNELCNLGTCRISARTDNIPLLDNLEPESCYTYWDIILTTNRGINSIKDVFIFVEDDCELKIEIIDDGEQDNESGEYKKLGEILVERGDADKNAIDQVLNSQKKIGELLVEAGVTASDKIASALAEQQHVKEIREKRQNAEMAATIRVPAERLDKLVNLVGEMVTVQSRLSQMSSIINNADLILVAEEVERLISELRDNTMSIRMLPIGKTFSKFKRLVRDLSAELGKEITLVTEGEETELDKTVIEKLNDPLVHIIRNSLDHGIETPAVREQAGKPQEGTVKLTAEHSGANVLIHISDDGAGMDPEAIRQKAIERNIIDQNDSLTEKEIYNLIFAPGFSLAQKITSVSGRGVGMDVVKRGIDALNGTIEIKSKKNEGTTITLKLPLTLAIIDGLLVRISDAFFILPLSSIEECVELTREDIRRMHGKHMTHIRGEVVPYIPLRERFRIEGDPPAIEQVIINRTGEGRIGLVVDQVIGQHQTVIKTMGKFYKHIKEVSGATILGDGTVALIIDITQLVQSAIAEASLGCASPTSKSDFHDGAKISPKPSLLKKKK
jgi:two-component system, chemotaxis family, sensor kinase CheA